MAQTICIFKDNSRLNITLLLSDYSSNYLHNLTAIGNDDYDGNWVGSSEIELLVGGNRIMEVYSRNSRHNKELYVQGCNAAIYRCARGNSVLAKASTKSRIYGSSGEPMSILTGFLLYE